MLVPSSQVCNPVVNTALPHKNLFRLHSTPQQMLSPPHPGRVCLPLSGISRATPTSIAKIFFYRQLEAAMAHVSMIFLFSVHATVANDNTDFTEQSTIRLTEMKAVNFSGCKATQDFGQRDLQSVRGLSKPANIYSFLSHASQMLCKSTTVLRGS